MIPLVRNRLPALLFGTAFAAAGCGSDVCDPAPGEICTIIGTGVRGYSGDEGPAREARLYNPMDVTLGPDGDLYVVDWNNHRIRVVDGEGIIRTVVGTGLPRENPAGPPRPALENHLNHPTQVVFDAQGNMHIAAWHNSRIKIVHRDTQLLEDGCGTGARDYFGDGGPAKEAALDLPGSVAFDEEGILYIMDQANQMIRTVDHDGIIERFAGQCIIGICDASEATACPDSDKVTCTGSCLDETGGRAACSGSFAGDGGDRLDMRMAQSVSQTAPPDGRIAFDAAGDLYFADTGNHRIRRIATDGTVETVAGNGERGATGDGPALEVTLNNPVGLAVGPDGTVYIADTDNHCIRALRPGGTLETVVGICGQRGVGGDGDPTETLLDRPYGVEIDPGGYLYVVDTFNDRVRLLAL